MEVNRGIKAVIYDIRQDPYFLILRKGKSRKWELFKIPLSPDDNENPEEALKREIRKRIGHPDCAIIQKLQGSFSSDGYSNEAFIVETSMNIPIKLPSESCDTYLWGKKGDILDSLTSEEDKQIFTKAYEELKKR